jgi:cyclopropane-fatty-acyl-phospholipid synthase
MSAGTFAGSSDLASAGRAFERFTRRAVCARLGAIDRGALTLVEGARRQRFGPADAELAATASVADPRFWGAIALRGSVGAAEAWMEGWWTSDALVDVIRVLARHRDVMSGIERGAARLAKPGLRLLHALRRNTRGRARRNIAAHYDLGNEFFALFLDPSLTYSCAVFERPEASLEEAQAAKYERICRKLHLRDGDHVLEIGTGWGGFALHAAGRHGCRVTTTTISRAQWEAAAERVRAAGLSDRVELLLEDYRDLRGRYDALVSIEMIEAVGAGHLDGYFRVCSERLRPAGAMALQAIVVADRDYESSRRNVDFVKRYVFPGGQLVSLGAICASLAAATDLRVTHVEDLTPHYAETLARWRARMAGNLDAMRALGLDGRFLRMWEYYLSYCEGAFRERANGVAQIVLEKPQARRPSWVGGLA